MESGKDEPKTTSTKRPEFPEPSKAYEEAFGSPVYRLSELMFGSLLAAYVLGFIGFAAAYSKPNFVPVSGELAIAWHLVIFRAPFLLISITYAYVTAGFYVYYHAGIMTMPHMPLERIRVDFALALSQAMFFGVSMLHPVLFPGLLGVTLIATFFRQLVEHRALVAAFHEELQTERRGVFRTKQHRKQRSLKDFRTHFNKMLIITIRNNKDVSSLSGWRKLPKLWLLYALVLVGFSVGSVLIIDHGIDETYIVSGVSLLTCVLIVISVNHTLGKHAGLLLNKMIDTNEEFGRLVDRL
jgi:hypothetical protein